MPVYYRVCVNEYQWVTIGKIKKRYQKAKSDMYKSLRSKVVCDHVCVLKHTGGKGPALQRTTTVGSLWPASLREPETNETKARTLPVTIDHLKHAYQHH